MRDWSVPAPMYSGTLQFLTRPPLNAWSGHKNDGASFQTAVKGTAKGPGRMTLGPYGSLFRPATNARCKTVIVIRMYQRTARFAEIVTCEVRGVRSSRGIARRLSRSSRQVSDDGDPPT